MVFTLGQPANFHRGTAIITFSDSDSPAAARILDLDEGFGPKVQGSYLEILTVRIEMTTTGTGGNRTLSVRLEATAAPNNILYEVPIGSNSLPANQSRTWQLAPEVEETMMPTTTIQAKLPPGLYVTAEQHLVIEDTAAIDINDAITVRVMSKVYDLRSL